MKKEDIIMDITGNLPRGSMEILALIASKNYIFIQPILHITNLVVNADNYFVYINLHLI